MIIHIMILWAWQSNWSKLTFGRWTKPATASLLAGALTDMTRNRADLIAENAMLRQHLIVLRRQVKGYRPYTMLLAKSAESRSERKLVNSAPKNSESRGA
jgi:hypothetical protein